MVSSSSPAADPLSRRSAILPLERRIDARSRTSGTATARPPILELALEGKNFSDTPILGAFDLTLDAGETLAITGPSGVGKSTLLRIIAGLDPDFRGRLRRPARLAMVFQEPTLLPWRSVLANLTLTTGIGRDGAEAALAEVGLAGQGGKFPGQLSLGQQRRLALARAFSARPELLLMDEPFVSLDAERAEEMYALFEALRARQPVATVLVTHAPAEAGASGRPHPAPVGQPRRPAPGRLRPNPVGAARLSVRLSV